MMLLGALIGALLDTADMYWPFTNFEARGSHNRRSLSQSSSPPALACS
jgi:hypothetical protein